MVQILLITILVQTAFAQTDAEVDSTLLKGKLIDSVNKRIIGPSNPYYFGTWDYQPVQKIQNYDLSSRMRFSSEYPNYVQPYPGGQSSDPVGFLISVLLHKIIHSAGNHKKQRTKANDDPNY